MAMYSARRNRVRELDGSQVARLSTVRERSPSCYTRRVGRRRSRITTSITPEGQRVDNRHRAALEFDPSPSAARSQRTVQVVVVRAARVGVMKSRLLDGDHRLRHPHHSFPHKMGLREILAHIGCG